jgi:hypothetical protein
MVVTGVADREEEEDLRVGERKKDQRRREDGVGELGLAG